MDKKKLLTLITKKEARRAELVAIAEKSEDVAELRAANTELDTLNQEIRDLQAIIDTIPDENERTAAVNSQIPGIVVAGTEKRTIDTEELEYRKAFMEYVTRGTEIPAELRDDEITKTTDVAHAIPSVLVNRIVEKLDSIGMILPLVTKTSFATGRPIPYSSVKPVASWVNEGASSDKQKKTIAGAITFSHYKLRCEVAMTMETSVMAISAFEAAFVRQVSEAMVKAIEAKIISTADGTTGMKGILAETPATGQALKADKLTYELLAEAEAALPQAYENNVVWCMTKKTFMGFIGMTDANGQPIARINYGIGGKPERTLLGRDVVLCGDYLDNFSTSLAQNKIFAFMFNFSEYILNTNYNMGIQRKQDWDTEDLLTKAVMAVDGKVVDKNSLVTIAKKS